MRQEDEARAKKERKRKEKTSDLETSEKKDKSYLLHKKYHLFEGIDKSLWLQKSQSRFQGRQKICPKKRKKIWYMTLTVKMLVSLFYRAG